MLAGGDDLLDFLGGGGSKPLAQAQTISAVPSAGGGSNENLPVVLQPAQGGGMMIKGSVMQKAGRMVYELCFVNQGQRSVSGLALQVSCVCSFLVYLFLLTRFPLVRKTLWLLILVCFCLTRSRMAILLKWVLGPFDPDASRSNVL